MVHLILQPLVVLEVQVVEDTLVAEEQEQLVKEMMVELVLEVVEVVLEVQDLVLLIQMVVLVEMV